MLAMPFLPRVRVLLLLTAITLMSAAQVKLAAQDPLVFTGTITQLDAAATRMTLSWTEGGVDHSIELAIGVATSVTRDGVGVNRTQLHVGARVTVIAMINIYVPLGILEATDIMLGHVNLQPLFMG